MAAAVPLTALTAMQALDLLDASDILESARIEPSVDGVFALDDVNAALAKVAAGGSKGKTILTLE